MPTSQRKRRIDPRTEATFPIRELGRNVGQNLHYNTVRRWHDVGLINQRTRRRVRLEVVRMSYGLATTAEAYWRFIERLGKNH